MIFSDLLDSSCEQSKVGITTDKTKIWIEKKISLCFFLIHVYKIIHNAIILLVTKAMYCAEYRLSTLKVLYVLHIIVQGYVAKEKRTTV